MGFLKYLSPAAALGETGIGKGLIDSFTGKGAQKALDKAQAQQAAAAEKARAGQTGAWDSFDTQARGDLTGGIGRVRSLYDPALNGSTEASDRQYGLLRGDQGAFDQYMANPAQAAIQAATAQRLGRYANASGKSYATSAGNSIANRGWLENFNTYQGQNAALGAEERGRIDAARNALAGAESGYAGDLARVGAQRASGVAGAYGQEGQQVGNAWGQWGQGTAANANTLTQNLLGLGGLALKATGWGGFGAGPGGTTQAGTAANGGWETTTTPANNNLFKFR